MSHTVLEALQALTKTLRTELTSPEVEARLAELRKATTEQQAHETELKAQVARYQTILARALDVAATTSLGSVAGRVLDGMIEVTDARRGFVGLVGDQHHWSILVARTRDRGDITDPSAQLSRTIVTEMLAKGDAVVTFDARHQDDKPADSVVALDLRSVACLPLRWEERTIGFVYLDDPGTRGLFDAAALTAVRAWVPLAAESVARALRHEGAAAGPLGVPTRSARMLAGLESLARVAGFDVTVLLTGETGTGKTMLARKVHESSPRAAKPFVHVNCGAIPEALLEGELFGAEAGAYTDARHLRVGRFEAADGGTLFLDELDAMPVGCQVKLLVALQERAITRLGSNRPLPVNVRVLAAMSADPARAIAEGRLREELYYRLAVIEVHLPPLRERTEDIPLIARGLIEHTRHRYALPPLRLTERALAQLVAHAWPGNVRELQNALDRAALFSRDGEIDDLWTGAPARTSTTPAGARASGELLGALEAAAARYVDEVAQNPRLRGLDLVDGFRGLVVTEAVRRFGGRDEAFRALGEETLVDNRNHHRVIRREVERLMALKERLQGT